MDSIGNDASRDLDQLTVAEAMPEGAVKTLVAIADADALVKKQSALDDHARHNTTSVYTAAEAFPIRSTEVYRSKSTSSTFPIGYTGPEGSRKCVLRGKS